jgi:hypothetical protein
MVRQEHLQQRRAECPEPQMKRRLGSLPGSASTEPDAYGGRSSPVSDRKLSELDKGSILERGGLAAVVRRM